MENNFYRMTIRPAGAAFSVFKLKRSRDHGYATDMAAQRFSWSVSRAATARFTGGYSECVAFIESEGALFMSEHGLPV